MGWLRGGRGEVVRMSPTDISCMSIVFLPYEEALLGRNE